MLNKLIKFGKETKETLSSSIDRINVGITIERTNGNIKVVTHFYADVEVWCRPYKGKTVLNVSYFENTDGSVYIGGEVVNELKLVEHLNSIGLNGIATKLQNTINSMEKCTDEDMAKVIQASEDVKKYFGEFIMYGAMSEEERTEYKEAR